MPSGTADADTSAVALARTAIARGTAALAGRDTAAAMRWLDRAHRLLPLDPNTALILATACLETDVVRAASLFADVIRKHDVRQAWLGLAAARLRLDGPEPAAEPLAMALSRHAFTPDALPLAEIVGRMKGWCALRSDGTVEIHPATQGRVELTLDGRKLRTRLLPADWIQARSLVVRRGGSDLLGSPIRIDAIRRLAGCVEIWEGGIRGWAWHPGDPDTDPVLTLTDRSKRIRQTFVARDESMTIADTGPLARPRSFHLRRTDLTDAAGPVHVLGPDGNELLGSPLDPLADGAAHMAASLRIGQAYPGGSAKAAASFTGSAVAPVLPADVAMPFRPVGAEGRRRAATVVIPVHNGGAIVLSCLASVLASVPADVRVLIIDDASSDEVLTTALSDLVQRRRVALLRHDRAMGFPASANAGIRAVRGRDVVLLNSDTLVPSGWLERLRDAAYSSADIGSVTPFSNDASILSYPGPAGANPRPDQAATNRLDRLAQQANGGATVDIPVGVGFCLYLRRDCLNVVGTFRTDVFAQGYGEENDLCLRARHLGWRSVALTGLFVGHHGGSSFGASAIHLRQRNSRIIEQLHPGYHSLIARFQAADTLADARRRIDLLVWRKRGRNAPPAVVLITHNDGGGVEQRLIHTTQALIAAGHRPIVLRPAEAANQHPAIAVQDGLSNDLPNLVFAVPQELPALLHLLRAVRVARIEAHHLAEYPAAIYDLIARLDVPYDVHIHDYASFCPRIALVAAHNRYCGEPDLPDCEACIADHGHFMRETISVAALRDRSSALLSRARRVVVPADDVGIRMRRHFPGLLPVTVRHEDDSSLPAPLAAATPSGRTRLAICIVGAIGVHKGYEVLLACARDAERRDLDLEFIIVGHTIDDARIMATGRVFVTGRFDPGKATELIVAQHVHFGFIPSICPETWCLGLSDLWRAGLHAASFDIGAPAERIRQTGRGFVLPLGLPPSAVNNALCSAIRSRQS